MQSVTCDSLILRLRLFVEINEDLFGRGKNRDLFKFFDCRNVCAAHSVFNILGYWLRWPFKCSRLPTPGVFVKCIIIGAQGLGSDPRAGQIRHSVASSSLVIISRVLGSQRCIARPLIKSQSRRWVPPLVTRFCVLPQV